MEKFEGKIEQIRLLGKVYGWQETRHDDYNCHLRFERKGVVMNVYYTKMTVGTALEHPTLGKTQLFRKNVSVRLLEELFNNPRLHTKIGYTKKTLNNCNRWRR